MITVTLFPPSIDREVVRYGWATSHPIPHQPGRSFEQRYEGIDLAWFAPELFLEIFLAFELKALGVVDGPVRLTLPSPVPAPVADFWRGYNNAWNVEIEPLSPSASYDPWAISPAMPLRPKRWGVFFGGGKDSSFVSQVLRETFGADDVLLLRGIYDGSGAPASLGRQHALDDRRILEPNRRMFGFPSARYHTTYPQTLLTSAAHARAHRELHTAGALPLLLAHGIETAAFCIEWSGLITPVADAEPPFARPVSYRSGPHYLASQSRHYRQTLGAPLTITNPLWAFSYSAIQFLVTNRYPLTNRTRVSCERPVADRWCMACGKCRRVALYLLAAGCYDDDYAFDLVLTRSNDSQGLRAHALATPSPGRNSPWSPTLPMPRPHFAERCDNIARIDLGQARRRLSADATAVLEDLVAAYGNVRYPAFLSVSRAATSFLPAHVRDVFLSIAAASLPVVDDTPDIVDPTGAVWAMPWRYDVALPTGMPG